MPTQQQNEQENYVLEASDLATRTPEILEPEWSENIFLGQRRKHRETLFRFSRWMSVASLLFLVGLIATQTVCRILIDQDFEIINDRGMQIIAVAIFGQVFGVVYVIAHAIWSNDEFKWMKNNKE